MKLPVTLTNPVGVLKNEQAAVPLAIALPPEMALIEHVPLLTSPGRNWDPETFTLEPEGPLAALPTLANPLGPGPANWMNAPAVTLNTACANVPLPLELT